MGNNQDFVMIKISMEQTQRNRSKGKRSMDSSMSGENMMKTKEMGYQISVQINARVTSHQKFGIWYMVKDLELDQRQSQKIKILRKTPGKWRPPLIVNHNEIKDDGINAG